ncbi:MAG: TAXI family TRAP transporter solute-binding subunit [Armatimonadetes bacterium]|nr:TAXI family TRAP transporter solute-binding subunit [Armatimonadota bacterium]
MIRAKGKRVLFLMLAGLLILALAGCGAKPADQKTEDQKPQGQVQRLSIGTGGTGGTYYPYGGAMAGIINKYVPGVEATAEVTGASVENARLLDSNEAQLGLLMNDVVYKAFKGENPFEKAIELRTLFVMYPNVFHAVTLKDSSVKTMADLKGKKVSVGSPGSGTETMSKQVLEALGITYDQFQVQRLSFSENTEALKNKVIEVGLWSVGPPTSSIMDLATTHQIRILSFSKDELARVSEKFPYYTPTQIPAGTYKGVDQDVDVPSVWNSVMVHKNMSEDLAYKIVKAIFEHKDDLVQVYAGAKETTPENALKHSVTPLHPGAVKYFKEKGLTVPDKLLPPEMK